MKKLLAMFIVLGVVLPILASLGGCTMTMDPNEHGRMYARNTDLNSRQVVEDWDYLWLEDEPSQLSAWNMPTKPR